MNITKGAAKARRDSRAETCLARLSQGESNPLGVVEAGLFCICGHKCETRDYQATFSGRNSAKSSS